MGGRCGLQGLLLDGRLGLCMKEGQGSSLNESDWFGLQGSSFSNVAWQRFPMRSLLRHVCSALH